MDQLQPRLRAALRKYWGYDAFRPLQEDIITSVMEGADTLALLPTGGGKSLCYQVPAVLGDGLCLVVSPLISLMKDQVQHLSDRGVKAACLVSGLLPVQQEALYSQCLTGAVKVLYVSPERLRQRQFIEHFRRMKVSLIAVDEAHCISQWGYDFRPPYLQIALIRAYHPKAPVLALTATATPEVARDICRQLCFRPKARTFRSSFVRENLAYMVFREQDKTNRLLRIVRAVGGSGIVYVGRRRRAREVAEALVANGVPAGYYHAGLSARERDFAQARWTKGEAQVMVATNAFGMGIDKPDVRFVVHLDIPESVEAYFQEAGRAGRDGKKAYAVLLYDDTDLETLDNLFASSFPTRQQIANVYRAVCNYYQLPVGAGEGCQFDFDLETLCRTYGFSVPELYNSLHFLEREGLLYIPDREVTESRLFIPIGREELYRFQVEQHRYGDLVTMLLRMYGGLFTDFVPISERAIARRTFLDEETVRKMLLHIHELKVIVYRPKTNRPQIYFTAPRIDVGGLSLNDSGYRDLKLRAARRLEAVKYYVTMESGCRSQYLVSYFGDSAAAPCGCCDRCIVNAPAAPDTALRQRIRALISQSPLRADEIAARIGQIDEADVVRLLRQMVDDSEASVNARFQYSAVR